jgi:release factor glutamine methyltransferase
MQVSDWLKAAEAELTASGVPTARLDSLVLLEDTLKKDRAWILANPEHALSADQVKILKKLLTRRSRHEPLAHLRGKTEFYGREFVINANVLEPRPESEAMIDCLLSLPGEATNWRIADVGSGSGAIGITAALELKSSLVDLLDIDAEAIKVSKINVDKFTLSLSVIKSDLLSSTGMDYDVLLCNLPYVPDDFHINLAASHEPRLAIFGGPDGLDIYRDLFKQLKYAPKKPLYILCESLPAQHEELSKIASLCEYSLLKTDDFIQVFTLGSLAD